MSRRDEDGSATAVLVVALPLLLLCLALVADLGRLFLARATLFAIADMAALAGVQELDLNRLAEGERHILSGPARTAAEAVATAGVDANFGVGAWREVEVEVVNASEEQPARHPWTGRHLQDPTVAVRIRLRLRLHFSPWQWGMVTVGGRADASVMPRLY